MSKEAEKVRPYALGPFPPEAIGLALTASGVDDDPQLASRRKTSYAVEAARSAVSCGAVGCSVVESIYLVRRADGERRALCAPCAERWVA